MFSTLKKGHSEQVRGNGALAKVVSRTVEWGVFQRVSVKACFICENKVDYSGEKVVAGSKALSGQEGHIKGTSRIFVFYLRSWQYNTDL